MAKKIVLSVYIKKYLKNFALKNNFQIHNNLLYKINDSVLTGVHFAKSVSGNRFRAYGIIVLLYQKWDFIPVSFNVEFRSFYKEFEWLQFDPDNPEIIFNKVESNLDKYFIKWLETRNSSKKIVECSEQILKSETLFFWQVYFYSLLKCELYSEALKIGEQILEKFLYEPEIYSWKIIIKEDIKEFIKLIASNELGKIQNILKENEEYTKAKLKLQN